VQSRQRWADERQAQDWKKRLEPICAANGVEELLHHELFTYDGEEQKRFSV
jgi:hypothetical protein